MAAILGYRDAKAGHRRPHSAKRKEKDIFRINVAKEVVSLVISQLDLRLFGNVDFPIHLNGFGTRCAVNRLSHFVWSC